jgi:undecaprenyl-diphosphatase
VDVTIATGIAVTAVQPPVAMGHVLIASQGALAIVLILVGGLATLHALGRKREAPRWPVASIAFGLALIAAMLAIAIGILTHGQIVRADASFASGLFAHRTAWADQAMMLISALGDGLERTIGTVVITAYLLWRRKVRWALALAAVMAAAAVLVPTLKTIFHFARPSLLYSGADAFSFPSGHATSAAAFYIVLAWIAARPLSRPLKAAPWALAATMIGLTGLSRIYVGAHWFSDVLAGLALGSALGVAGVTLAARGLNAQAAWGRRDGVAILAILIAVGTALGPAAFAKARHVYAPYLARPVEKVVDPGHLSDPDHAPIVAPPGV